MRKIKLISIFILLFSYLVVISQTYENPEDNLVAKAREIAEGLFQKIRRTLLEISETGDFAKAAEVCSEIAQKLTKEYAEEKKVEIRRVTLKTRNPLNKPDEFEETHLRFFEERASMKEENIEHYEITEEKGRKFLRYMKPVFIQEMCLKCHGNQSNIPSEVKKILSKRYPQDKAIGYKVGDIRGAITLKIPLE